MSQVMVLGASGLCFFLPVYLSFDYWVRRIWEPMLASVDECVQVREELFSPKEKSVVFRDHMVLSLIFTLLVFFVFSSYPLFAIIAAAFTFKGAWKLPRLYFLHIVKASRIKKFTLQLIDALTLMANGMKSGLNIPQALQIVVDEMPRPVREEFGLILSENKVGLPLDKAFENLAKRVPTEDVSMFVTSVNILRETGGNVAETFETIVRTVRERLKLQSKISAMTAQGMTSAVIVGALPWGLAIVLYFMDPVMMGPLFTTPFGWAILMLVVLLEVVGFYVIVKMVTIRV